MQFKISENYKGLSKAVRDLDSFFAWTTNTPSPYCIPTNFCIDGSVFGRKKQRISVWTNRSLIEKKGIPFPITKVS